MTTKLEDAKSIVQDEEVLKELELKSQATDVLVVKSDEGEQTPAAEEPTKENTVVSPEPEAEVAVAAVAPAVTPASIDGAITDFRSKIVELKSRGVNGEDALKELQGVFNGLGEVVKAEFTPPPTPEQIIKTELESTLRSLLSEMLPSMLAQTVAPMQSEMQAKNDELRAMLTATPGAVNKSQEVVPSPRSLQLDLVQKAAVEKLVQKTEPSSFAKIANASVGLPENFVR